MLRPLLALALAALTASSAAAAPLTLQHQARLLDPTGAPIQGPIALEVSLWSAAEGGAALWSAAYAPTAEDGYVSLTLATGEGGAALDPAWFEGDVWLELAVDGAPLRPRTPIASVPRAGSTAVATDAARRVAATDTVAPGETLRVAHGFGSPDLAASAWIRLDGRWRALPVFGCTTCGNGADGAYVANSNRTLPAGRYEFTSFSIAPGVTVTVTGTEPLEIYATDAVTIAGTLSLSGANGTDSSNASGWSICPAPNGWGVGGAGGAGGFEGGSSAMDYCAEAAAPTTSCTCGEDGAGPGGGARGRYGGTGGGGGGGGHTSAGASGTAASSGAAGGAGGGAYASVDAGTLRGGSGGGSGSAGGGANAAGSGGGGGGGAVRIVAPDVVISGALRADGGRGGSQTGTGDGGAGGGGAGGAVWITADEIAISGAVSAVGGAGGSPATNDSVVGGRGGNGSAGRIRLDARVLTGTTTPPADVRASSVGSTAIPLHLEQVDEDTVELLNPTGAPAELKLILVH